MHGKSGFEYIINGFAKPRAGYGREGGTDVGPEPGKSVPYFGKIENLSLVSENLVCSVHLESVRSQVLMNVNPKLRMT